MEFAIVQDIAGTNLVGSLVDVLGGIWIIELMKLPFNSDVVFEIEGSVEAITLEALWTVVGIPIVKHGADLQLSFVGCRRNRLGVKTGTREAEQTDQRENPQSRENVS